MQETFGAEKDQQKKRSLCTSAPQTIKFIRLRQKHTQPCACDEPAVFVEAILVVAVYFTKYPVTPSLRCPSYYNLCIYTISVVTDSQFQYEQPYV